MDLWAFLIVGGPVVLAIAFAYALLRRRRLTPQEKVERSVATERGYTEPERHH